MTCRGKRGKIDLFPGYPVDGIIVIRFIRIFTWRLLFLESKNLRPFSLSILWDYQGFDPTVHPLYIVSLYLVDLIKANKKDDLFARRSRPHQNKRLVLCVSVVLNLKTTMVWQQPILNHRDFSIVLHGLCNDDDSMLDWWCTLFSLVMVMLILYNLLSYASFNV